MSESDQSSGEFLSANPTPERVELSSTEKFKRDLNKIDAVIELLLSDDLPDPEAIKLAWAMRANLTEAIIKSFEAIPYHPEYHIRVQFDLMIDKADIFERLGDNLRSLIELDGAEFFALQYHLDDVVLSLGEEIDIKAGGLDNSPDAIIIKLRGKINDDNRDFLRVLVSGGIDMSDLVETIRQMVVKEGGDPDEVLASLNLKD